MNSLPVNTFKQKLAANKVLIGLWCNFAHLPITEIVSRSGYDWLLLDMEHSPTDLATKIRQRTPWCAYRQTT